MKDRIKWMLVGLGFTFGLQVIISLIFTGIAVSAAQSQTGIQQGTISVLVFGFTLGAFLIGGFVIGWMSEELRIADALIVALITLILSALVYTALPSEGSRGTFVTASWLSEMTTTTAPDGLTRTVSHIAFGGRSLLFAVLALIASAVGNYLGWHVRVPEEGVLDRVALVVGLVGAIVGPFVLLSIGGHDPSRPDQPNLPWYFLAIVLVLLLVIIGVGFVMFTRESHYEDEISISPEHRRDEEAKG
jgi:MFS family permease